MERLLRSSLRNHRKWAFENHSFENSFLISSFETGCLKPFFETASREFKETSSDSGKAPAACKYESSFVGPTLFSSKLSEGNTGVRGATRLSSAGESPACRICLGIFCDSENHTGLNFENRIFAIAHVPIVLFPVRGYVTSTQRAFPDLPSGTLQDNRFRRVFRTNCTVGVD